MTTEYRTVEGDVVDAICYDHYGRTDVLIQVYDANPGLADQPVELPSGLIIQLPDVEAPVAENPIITLW